MSEFFKSKRKIGMIFGAVFLCLTLAAGTVAWVLLGGFPAAADAPPESDGAGEVENHEEWTPEDFEEDYTPEPEPEPEPEILEPVYHVPSEMRGVYIVPGSDFLKDLNASESAIKAEIDKAVTDAANFTMNTIIVDTVYKDKVIFDTAGAPRLSAGFDVMEYIMDAARAQDLHVYAIFDASLFEESQSPGVLSVNAGAISRLAANLREFAAKYSPDAVLIDGYVQTEQEGVAYGAYLLSGGGIGYNNYVRQSPAAVVKTASRTLRNYAPNIQVGLLADAVWANDSEQPQGSATKASFTAFGSGNADTKAFVQEGIVDFVAVKAFSAITDSAEPFETVVSWWADVSRSSGIPMYVVHASSKACSQNTGWASHDQLTRQVISASSQSGYAGSMFDSLSRLVANPQSTTTTLVKYFEGEVKSEHILTELQITKPEKTTFTTQEPSVTFTGASDPNSPVTINGREITTDASGYFTANYDLAAGENTFTIEHKAKTLVYKITRNIEILKEAAPTGTITTDGNMSIKISALAYEDANVTAVINGETVSMAIDDTAEDETSRDSNYKRFVGYYTTPPGTSQEQNLGSITINASWQSLSKSLTGATVKVNKKARIEDGVPVVVIADQARTYPPNTLNNVPDARFYPIPKGAMDYAVGEEITYVSEKNVTFKYQVLASGLRVESKDIQAITTDYASGNAISGLNVTTEGRYTYVTLKTAQKVSYKIAYSGSDFTITFHNTTKNPGGSTSLDKNPIFTKASWGSDSLTLTLAKNGGFMGYKGYYDSSGNLVFRFNTPPASLNGARIAVDPGHGGPDYGALGFLAAYPEKVINLSIAKMLVAELEARGATVMMIENSGNPSLENRVKQAEAFNADLFVSVHNNTATRASAVGTETFYFYPYAKNAAAAIAAQVSSQLGTENRGAKQSYYHITLSSQMPSILLEGGFLSNKNEYEKLINENYQQAIAVGIADGIGAGISSAYTGIASTGSQSVGSGAAATTDPGDVSNTDNDVELEELYFDLDEVKVNEGKSYTLKVFAFPDEAGLQGITFKSSNTSVATVSAAGVVTAVKEGKAKMTVSSADGAITGTCQVEVVSSGGEEDPEEKPKDTSPDSTGLPVKNVKDVWFEHDPISITRNSTVKLNIESELGYVRNTDFLWSSDDTDIATVDASGRVTAKKAGTVFITAHTADNAHYIDCVVDVTTTRVAVKSIKLNKSELFLKKGTTEKLQVTFSPYNATNREITWTTSKKSVATVDSNGLVTAKSTGSTTITATSKDGKFTATCEVEVTSKEVKIEEIYIGFETLDVYLDEITQIDYEVYPYNATNNTVTWKSSNTSILTVDENGYISPKKTGTVTVTATSADGKVKATCEITVLD